MLDEELTKKAQAVFLGVAIGDALGATTEFMTTHEIKAKYKVHKKMVGGGWLGVKPGQVTDDTEMSLAVATAILVGEEWNLNAIADNFLAWMRKKPIDIGATVRKGIASYRLKGKLEVPLNQWDAGNGALMRMAPVALFTLGDDQLLKRYSLEQAHLTHNHPLSDAACICIGRMVHAAILGADRFQLHAIARELIAEHKTFRFNNYKGLASGYVVDTVQTVLHYFFTTASFEECLIGVVNQGGDADTTGAIAGMLCGAFYGLDSLPKQWLQMLDKQVKTEIEDSSNKLIQLSPWVAKESHIQELSGNLWDYYDSGYVVAITTNGKVSKSGCSVMARGTAKQAAELYPSLPKKLGSLINNSGNHVYDLGQRIVNFPVEHSPWEVPDLHLIIQSCRELRTLADHNNWQKVIVPRPGCGGGGLSWEEVKPLLEPHFDERFRVITASTK